MSQKSPKSKKTAYLLKALKWIIALAGIWLVVSNLTLHDHLWLVDEQKRLLVHAGIEGDPGEKVWPVTVKLPDGSVREVKEEEALTKVKGVTAVRKADRAKLKVQGILLAATPNRVFAAPDDSTPGAWYELDALEALDFDRGVLPPTKEIGLSRMVREADSKYLILAVAVIPIVYLITGYRWYLLLSVLGVPIPLGRAIQINLVGTFYNTFLPGQTGGDFIKAYYAAKIAHTQRTRAVLSVVVDRVIGLVALVAMGGLCAAAQWQIPECRRVAIGAAVIIALLVAGIVALGVSSVRRAVGLDSLMRKLPMQAKVEKLIEALRLYKQRPWLVVAALAMSVPVHATVVISAMFAGFAFGLPLRPTYYWVVVPTVILAGAMPISPQGAGVMEFFAIILTRTQGATVGQAVALTLSIRLVQIVWNLASGILVLRGGYSKPTEAEQAQEESGTALPA